MAESKSKTRYRQTGKQRRASPDYDRAIRLAVESLFQLWRAAIRKHFQTRSKRKPSEGKVSTALSAMSENKRAAPLLRELRYLVQKFGKPYFAWSESERMDGAIFVQNVLNDVRISAFERPRGRPKKKRQRVGIIAAELLKGTEDRRKRVREMVRAMKSWLPSYVRGYKLAMYANKKQMRPETTPEAVERFVGKNPDRINDVEQAASTARAVRDALNDQGLNLSWAKALEQHLSRVRKK